jgi:hypothetical protein
MKPTFTIETIERKIYLIRGQKVMLDSDLAALYGVATGALNRAVKRNTNRFPEDFMFQLTAEESDALRCQTGILELHDYLRAQIVTSKTGRGGRRYQPYVFTEQGVAMLSSVLNSDRAVKVNITIMRAFVKLREMIASHKELTKRLDEMENDYDSQFKVYPVRDCRPCTIRMRCRAQKIVNSILDLRAISGNASMIITQEK